jgi:CO/xanthine dehydrogenase FAD-binding subunit
MHRFDYVRPATLGEAIALLDKHGPNARLLAGGTDLIIRLRDGTLTPEVVVDVKRIAELHSHIETRNGVVSIGAMTTMTEIMESSLMQRHYRALVEAAAVVGSIQIRNRATLVGNICNASPAADTAPALLVYGAEVVARGPAGERRIQLDDFFVRSGVTTLDHGELVIGIELPLPDRRAGAVHLRRTRRRGHDLASVTLCCSIDEAGVTRLAYGSVGPRPFLVSDESGVLAGAPVNEAAHALLDRMLGRAAPSPTSMRASPDYRLAMLRVLAQRGLRVAHERLHNGAT